MKIFFPIFTYFSYTNFPIRIRVQSPLRFWTIIHIVCHPVKWSLYFQKQKIRFPGKQKQTEETSVCLHIRIWFRHDLMVQIWFFLFFPFFSIAFLTLSSNSSGIFISSYCFLASFQKVRVSSDIRPRFRSFLTPETEQLSLTRSLKPWILLLMSAAAESPPEKNSALKTSHILLALCSALRRTCSYFIILLIQNFNNRQFLQIFSLCCWTVTRLCPWYKWRFQISFYLKMKWMDFSFYTMLYYIAYPAPNWTKCLRMRACSTKYTWIRKRNMFSLQTESESNLRKGQFE